MVKRQTTITFYGGVNEIGGNKILIQDRGTKVFLDFGMSFYARRQFYSPPFLLPRSERSLQELGILPKIDGVYKFDEKPPEIDAIFVSHAHMDHSAYLSFVNREIPVYCGETAKAILRTLSEVRRADLEFDIEDVNFVQFRTGDRIKGLGDVEVEPIHVDHSIPGSYGFVIHTSSGTIVYTGDFRAHGAKPQMTYDFMERAKDADPVAVITEATNMIGAHISSEAEVEGKLNEIVKRASGIVLADFAYTDIDRLSSFHRVAKVSGRFLAISLRQAYLLEALRDNARLSVPSLNDENILIFRKSKKTKGAWETRVTERYGDKVKGARDISKQQREIVLALSFYDLEELMEIRPEAGSCYVLSASEPLNEEMEADFDRLINWLKHYGLPQYHVHVSGHVMPLQLKNILEEVGAAKIFPVHTEHADLFRRFTQGLKGKTVLVERGKEYAV